MRTPLRQVLPLTSFVLGTSVVAQTLTEANSIPPIGLIESHVVYYDADPGTLATSGTGVTWDASGVVANGTYSYSTYSPPSASPYSAAYPTATICAEVESNGAPLSWYHWHVTSSLAESLGINADEFVGGRTECEFPFSLGSSFSDTYTVFGSPSSVTMEYVASGSINAPWGIIPNVVMFDMNGGTSYIFYRAENLLNDLGYYVPGFGLQVDDVTIIDAIGEHAVAPLMIWPSPASEAAYLALPLKGTCTVMVQDATGREVRRFTSSAPQIEVDVREMGTGTYVVTAIDGGGARAMGRLVVR